MDVLRKELCVLKLRKKCIQNLEKISKFLFCCILLIWMERNAHITSNLAYCSVKCLSCFKLVILNVQEMPQ